MATQRTRLEVVTGSNGKDRRTIGVMLAYEVPNTDDVILFDHKEWTVTLKYYTEEMLDGIAHLTPVLVVRPFQFM